MRKEQVCGIWEKSVSKEKKWKSLLIKFSYDTAQSMKERMPISTAEIMKVVIGN